MVKQPTENPTDLPPLDTSKISIEITALDSPDFQFDFEVPVELISEITERIQGGGLKYNEQEMGQLIVQVCLDEGMQRLDRDSAWGTSLLTQCVGRYSTDKPFTFSAVVDVLPNEDFPIDSIPIQRNQFQVNEALIDTELQEQRLQFGTRKEHSGVLAYGDEITCKAVITLSEEVEPVLSLESCTIRVPNETQQFVLGGLPLEEVGSQLRGIESAEELSFDIVFSDQFPAKSLRGKKGTLELKNCTFIRISPSTVDHVLEQYGTPNEAILRTQIKMSLQHNFDRENTNFMIHQLYDYLLENVDIPISKRIVNKNFDDFCKKEIDATGAGELTEEQKNMLLAKAARLVKRMTINAWLQRSFKLGVSEDDVDKQAAILAEERRVRPADIKEEFLTEDKISVLGNMATERKIFERLKDKMVFSDI